MTPITPLDLLTPHGARELAELAWPEGQDAPDAPLLLATLRGEERSAWSVEDRARADQAVATLQGAVDTGNARVGRVASGRVLSADEETLLRTCAADIARYRLYDDARLSEDHPVRLRYADAQRFLERVADGREPLGQPLAGTAGSPAAEAPERLFSRETLAEY